MRAWAVLETPLGPLALLRSQFGIRQVSFLPAGRAGGGEDSFPPEDRDPADPVLVRTGQQLEEYLTGGRREFELELDLVTTPFYRRVLEEVSRIPYGETASYREVAGRLGVPGGARAVGNAVARNPLPLLIPCHRVIAHDGGLGGYGGGRERKTYLLRLEGVI